ncbi:MAG: thioredoxin [Phycisphaerae bacterium]
MAGANVLHFDDSNFETEVLKSSQPVLVDFWATWCGPCQMLAPTIDELAGEYSGKVKVGKLDVDQAARTAAKYGVQSIPTVLVFENGQAVQRIVGAKAKKEYKAILDAKVGAK